MLLGEYRLFGGGGDINRPSGGGRISPAPWGGGMNGGINGGGGPGINGGINGGGGSTPISGGAFGDSTRIGEGALATSASSFCRCSVSSLRACSSSSSRWLNLPVWLAIAICSSLFSRLFSASDTFIDSIVCCCSFNWRCSSSTLSAIESLPFWFSSSATILFSSRPASAAFSSSFSSPAIWSCRSSFVCSAASSSAFSAITIAATLGGSFSGSVTGAGSTTAGGTDSVTTSTGTDDTASSSSSMSSGSVTSSPDSLSAFSLAESSALSLSGLLSAACVLGITSSEGVGSTLDGASVASA
uniref:Uncharacterized protein n=1 Tax=Anopheles coluzzii TaxID=1518534 RepID=A0A8W7PFB7_ANOCL